MAASQQMAYRVYTVLKRESQDDFWLAIGAAFAHADGKGFNVVLQALLIDGKVVLREPKEDETQRPSNDRAASQRRERK